MTGKEMKYDFEVKNELIGGLELPDLTDDEIDVFLNNAQDKIVEELYKSSGTEFLTELLTTSDLIYSTDSTAYTEIDNAEEYTLATISSDVIFFVDAALKLTRTNPDISTAQWIQCEKIKKEIAHNFAETGFNTPWFENPKLFLEDGKIVVIVDGYTTSQSNLKFEYIKRPTRIDVTDATTECELREFLHKDVVDRAIILLLDSYKSKMKEEGSKK